MKEPAIEPTRRRERNTPMTAMIAETDQRKGSLEPLLRLDATVRREPAPPWEQAPLRRRNIFQLHREGELPELLRRPGATQLSAEAPQDGDRRRPTDLATHREERRQVIAVSRLICHATMESLAGVRPVQQLQRWLEHTVYQKVRERADLLQRTRRLKAGRSEHQGDQSETHVRAPLSLRRIRAHQVAAGVWEVSVIFNEAARTRACALRLEAHRGRWRAIALELG